MNDEQYKRYRKMNAEVIKVLIRKIDKKDKTIHYLVEGDSGTHYKVSIYKTGKITCSCPDYKYSVEKECVCKHCLFIIINVLKMFKNNLYHPFYERHYFTPDELSDIYKYIRTN